MLAGPYKKLGEPVLRADIGRNVIGPGACSVIKGNHGLDLMAYHSWDQPPPNNKFRACNVASVFWNGDIPTVAATWGQVGHCRLLLQSMSGWQTGQACQFCTGAAMYLAATSTQRVDTSYEQLLHC